jgi:hypothetical protein
LLCAVLRAAEQLRSVALLRQNATVAFKDRELAGRVDAEEEALRELRRASAEAQHYASACVQY